MKSTKDTSPRPPNIKFPTLMIYKDDSFVVLFNSGDEGVVVWSENLSYKLGHYSECWSDTFQSNWKPFNGSITLEN